MEAINQILQVYADQFSYDIAKMSEPWMWYWGVPIGLYSMFFFVKWFTLTFPIWFPFYMIANASSGRKSNGKS